MTTLRQNLLTTLNSHAPLTTLLTGGIYDTTAMPQVTHQAGWEWAVDQGLVLNGVTLVPHAKVRWRNSTPHQADHPKLGAERQSVELYLYDDLYFDTALEPAQAVLKALLHDTYMTNNDDRQIAYFLVTHMSGELPAVEYGNRPMAFVRCHITHIRS